MVYFLSWLLVVALLALWSLAAWALHGLLVWAVANAGSLAGVTSNLGGLSLPEWLAPWVPAELMSLLAAMQSGLAPVVEALVQAAPAFTGGLGVLSWVIWGIGSVLIVLLGVGLHGAVLLWRRRGRAAPVLAPRTPYGG